MANTVNRAYPRPDPLRDIADEFPVSDQALQAIDADIGALFAGLMTKAVAIHTHAIGDVTGLQTALDGKSSTGHAHAFDDLTDVAGTSAAPDGFLLVKMGGLWIPGSAASVIGNHQHVIADVLLLQDALDSKLAAAGGTMTGPLTLSGAPTLGLHAATKGYVDGLTTGTVPVQIAAGTDTDFLDADFLVARKADGSLVKRSWANVKALLAASAATLVSNLASIADYRSNSSNKVMTTNSTWSSAVEVVVPFAAPSLVFNMSTFINAVVTMTNDTTFANPTNVKPGQSGVIRVVQDAAGSRGVSFGADWEFAGGAVPVFSIAANTQDLLFYHVIDTGRVFAQIARGTI